ncbi:ribbon-helix-helix protein [Frondihabitans sp. PhB188]|uniref:ribbon-helix-helix domain-containing protein n=1 Tax=Frondihabitans sp. PhB188 TaxID=2485200 RepID=UPI000F46BB1B|nr:ribbon-helix-helix domain-containing protein [Frondihabitans sp. PhB188]ROQ41557.1 ribbon-helix-helix protein [Frondihabitans sp. PhB188]
MIDKNSDEDLADPTIPIPTWESRPGPVTGDEAKALGRMLLDDAVPADDVITRARRGPAALGGSGAQSPVLRFRVAEEEQAELQELARVTHLNQSALLREGLRMVLAHYRDPGLDSGSPAVRLEATVTVQLSTAEVNALRAVTQRADNLAS